MSRSIWLASILDSQFADLAEPGEAITVEVYKPADAIFQQLRKSSASADRWSSAADNNEATRLKAFDGSRSVRGSVTWLAAT